MPRKYVPKTGRKNRHHKAVAPAEVRFKPGFLAALDQRTELAKALHARRAQIIEDIGGEGELSRVKAALIDRFVWLECMLQTWEFEMAQGNSESAARWTQAVNALSGLASKLGLDKKATAMPWQVLTPTATNGNGSHGKPALPIGLKELPADDAE